MKYRVPISKVSHHSQEGIILISIAVILVMIGFTTFSALSSSRVELNIASSRKKVAETFNYTELLSSEAERSISSLSESDILEKYNQSENDEVNQTKNKKLDSKIDWLDKDIVNNAKKSESDSLNKQGENRYFVQYLGRRNAYNESLNNVSVADDYSFQKDYFLVTARFDDRYKGITREVQTIFSVEALD